MFLCLSDSYLLSSAPSSSTDNVNSSADLGLLALLILRDASYSELESDPLFSV
jgi:hypothetical protein